MNGFHRNAAHSLAVAAFVIAGLVFSQASVTVASTTLKTVTTTDQTASVGLPTGWKLKKGLNGFVWITGPNSSDEQINLGTIIIAKNAPSGTPINGEVLLAQPYNSSFEDKFTAIFQTAAAKKGKPQPQITFANEVPTKFQACSRFWGSMTEGTKPLKFEAVLCSLKPDMLGLYKNVFYVAQVPSSLAVTDRPIVEQIVQSYRITPSMFKKMIAPYTTPPPPSAGAAMPAAGMYGAAAALQSANCFDYNVIRESPPWEMPSSCGGWQPG